MLGQAKTILRITLAAYALATPSYAAFESLKPKPTLGSKREVKRGIDGDGGSAPVPAAPATVSGRKDFQGESQPSTGAVPEVVTELGELPDGTPAFIRYVLGDDGQPVSGDPVRYENGNLCTQANDDKKCEPITDSESLESLAQSYISMQGSAPDSPMGKRWATFSEDDKRVAGQIIGDYNLALQSGAIQNPDRQGPHGQQNPSERPTNSAPKSPYVLRAEEFAAKNKWDSLMALNGLLDLVKPNVGTTRKLKVECLGETPETNLTGEVTFKSAASKNNSGLLMKLDLKGKNSESESQVSIPMGRVNTIPNPGNRGAQYHSGFGVQKTKAKDITDRAFISVIDNNGTSEIAIVQETIDLSDSSKPVRTTRLCRQVSQEANPEITETPATTGTPTDPTKPDQKPTEPAKPDADKPAVAATPPPPVAYPSECDHDCTNVWNSLARGGSMLLKDTTAVNKVILAALSNKAIGTSVKFLPRHPQTKLYDSSDKESKNAKLVFEVGSPTSTLPFSDSNPGAKKYLVEYVGGAPRLVVTELIESVP